jgi:hypothetical protein
MSDDIPVGKASSAQSTSHVCLTREGKVLLSARHTCKFITAGNQQKALKLLHHSIPAQAHPSNKVQSKAQQGHPRNTESNGPSTHQSIMLPPCVIFSLKSSLHSDDKRERMTKLVKVHKEKCSLTRGLGAASPERPPRCCRSAGG